MQLVSPGFCRLGSSMSELDMEANEKRLEAGSQPPFLLTLREAGARSVIFGRNAFRRVYTRTIISIPLF